MLSLIFSLFRVSSFSLLLKFKSVRPDVIMSGVSSVFPENPLWPVFWTALFGLCLDEPVINLVAISTLGRSLAVEIASGTRLLMAATTPSTSLLKLSGVFLSKTWFWHTLLSPRVKFTETPRKTSYCTSVVSFSATLAWLLPPISRSAKDNIKWLRNFLYW